MTKSDFFVLHTTMPNTFHCQSAMPVNPCYCCRHDRSTHFFALFYTANRRGVYFRPQRALSVGWMVGWMLHVCPPKRQIPAITCHRLSDSASATSFYAPARTLLTSFMLWPSRALFVSISLLRQVASQSSFPVINRHEQRVFYPLSFLKGSLI